MLRGVYFSPEVIIVVLGTLFTRSLAVGEKKQKPKTFFRRLLINARSQVVFGHISRHISHFFCLRPPSGGPPGALQGPSAPPCEKDNTLRATDAEALRNECRGVGGSSLFRRV